MKENTFDAAKMKELRKEKKLSQKELASLAGVSFSALRAYENERYTPKFDVIERICAALGVHVSTLYKGTVVRRINPIVFDSPLEFEKAWFRNGGGPHFNDEIGREAAAIVKFEDLNEAGQRTAIDLLDLVLKVPEYRKEN